MSTLVIGDDGHLASHLEMKNSANDPLDVIDVTEEVSLLKQSNKCSHVIETLPTALNLKLRQSEFEDDTSVASCSARSGVVFNIVATVETEFDGSNGINMAEMDTLEKESFTDTFGSQNSLTGCQRRSYEYVDVSEAKDVLKTCNFDPVTAPMHDQPSDRNEIVGSTDSAVVASSSAFHISESSVTDDSHSNEDKDMSFCDEPVALIHNSKTVKTREIPECLSEVALPEAHSEIGEVNRLSSSDSSQTVKQTLGNDSDLSSNNSQASNLSFGKKLKPCSGVINKCIDNLRLRGLEINTGCVGTKAADVNSNVEADIFDSLSADAVGTAESIVRSLSSRSHRKSRKPTKVPHRAQVEEIDIRAATKALSFSCSVCTFSCNTQSELTEHVSICHTGKITNDVGYLFSCTYCKIPAKNREHLRFHLAQHPGSHVFRCFTCPYCSVQADHMDTMDDHIGLHHPAEDFRFEVSQERVSYLQNMLECPVCNGAFPWKIEFVNHMITAHNLISLASHLETEFPTVPIPTCCRVSVHLFEGFAEKVCESLNLQEESDTRDEDESQIESKAGENKHLGASSEYVLNMEKIVDELFRNKEHDLSDKEDFFNGSDYCSSAVKGITKDIWFSSESGQKNVDNKSFVMMNENSTPAIASSVGGNLSVPDAQTCIAEWDNYAGIDVAAGGVSDDSDANSHNFDVDDTKEIMNLNSKRAILRCSLCPFVCDRTPNFRRHLAIHERQSEYADGYKCAYCHFQHRRLNCIRFHLGKYHGHLPARLCRIINGAQLSVMDADDVVQCPDGGGDNLSVSSESEDLVCKKPTSDDVLLSSSPTANVISPDPLGREKRLSKPPKRLSDTVDFQSPVSSLFRPRRTSLGHSEYNIPYMHNDVNKNCSPPFYLAAEDRRTDSPIKSCSGKPFDESISVDYYASTLPPGMIYQKPIKCPRCDFTNRVRINLVRHMKQHHMEDLLDEQAEFTEINQDKMPMTWDACSENDMPMPLLSRGNKRNDDSRLQDFIVKSEPMDQDSDWNNPHVDDALELTMSQGHREAHGFSPVPHSVPTSQSWKTNFENARPSNVSHLNRKRSAFFEGEVDELSYDHNKMKLQNVSSGSHNHSYEASSIDRSHDIDFDALDRDGQNQKRMFKCAYCSVSSRWNRRDISLHVLHVHIRRRAFRCRRCGYSTSKSASAVTVHCARTHPGKPAIIEDNLAILNSILPVHARPGLVHVAFRRPDGAPEMDARALERYFGITPETTLPEKQPAEDRARMSHKRVLPSVLPKPVLVASNLPLDLSAPVSSRKSINKPDHNVTDPVKINSNMSKTFIPKEIPIKREPLEDPRSAIVKNVVNNVVNNVMPQRANSIGVSPVNLQTASKVKSAVQKTKPLTQGSPNAAFYRCRQCGYQDLRHDKTKYHVVREHLHLGPYGCVYCPRYMWGRRHVARHIDATHPGMPIKIRRAFDEFETYLRQNIRKIGGLPERTKVANQNASAAPMAIPQPSDMMHTELRLAPSVPEVRPYLKPVVAESTAEVPSGNRLSHVVYQCGHCDFRDALAARVQGHCLAKHPSKPVRFQRCEAERNASSSFADSSSDTPTGLKIQSVESLSMNRGKAAVQNHLPSAVTLDNNSRSTMKGVQPDQWKSSRADGDHGSSASRSHYEDTRKGVMETASHAAVDCESILSSDDENDGEFSDGLPMYVCLYCPEVACSEDEIRMHIKAIHPGQPVKFGNKPQRSELTGSVLGRDNGDDKSAEILSSDEDQQEIDGKGSTNGAFIYRCKICRYRSDKVTVVRHHVMAHLLYHPYRCPYCDTVRSVKSSPITKHIRGRHPGREQSFICLRDDNLERQVRKNYYRSEQTEVEDSLPPPPPIARRAIRQAAMVEPLPSISSDDRASTSPDMDSNFEDASGASRRMSSSRRSLYRCKFCGLTTHVRTDMRHHLMREIGYKPFRCGHCYAAGASYAEPSRSAMGKHFRMRHSGMTVEVHDLSDPAKESEVFDLLDSSMVEEGTENEDVTPPPIVSGGNVKRIHAGTLQVKPSTLTRPVVSPAAVGTYKANEVTSILPRKAEPPMLSDEYIADAIPKRRLRVGSVHLRRCQHCSYTTKSPKALAQHIAVRHRPRGLRCAYCDHTAHYPSWLRKHSQKTHPDMPFKFIQIGGDRFNVPSGATYDGLPLSQDEALIEPWGNEAAISLGGSESDAGDGSGSANGSSVSILLDGAEVDIPLVADPIGLYHCPVCAYQTSNKAHFKMHFMIHRPRKWQCIYCRLKFPLLFRLRHHYTTNHPGLPVQWRDLTTGQLCDQSTNLSSITPSPSLCSTRSPVSASVTVQPIKKQFTARKSTARTGLRVAMFRCGQFFSIRHLKASSPCPKSENRDIVEGFDDDADYYSLCSSSSASLVLCCQLCTYKTDEVDSLWQHLKSDHRWGVGARGTRYPSIEILPDVNVDGDESGSRLQQCGFCSYMTSNNNQFVRHVEEVHEYAPPLSCSSCGLFASFSRLAMSRHLCIEHSTDAEAGWQLLTKPYTMRDYSAADEAIKQLVTSFRVDPSVVLSDISPLVDF